MSAQIFIDKLEATNLLDDEVIGKLRRKIAKPGKTPAAKAVANYCTEKGFLTEAQANRILETVNQEVQRHQAAAAQPLDAIDDDGTGQGGNVLSAADLVVDDDVAEVEPVEEIVDLETQTPAGVEPVGQVADPFAAQPVAAAANADPYGGASPSPLEGNGNGKNDGDDEKKFSGKKVHEQSFESRWIILGSFSLVFLLLAGWFFYTILTKADSDKVFDDANQQFADGSYPAAVEAYKEFIKNYKGDPNVPYAHVKYRLAEMKIAAAGKDVDNTVDVFEKNADTITEIMVSIEDPPFKEEIRKMIAYDTVVAAQKAANASAAKPDVEEKQIALDKAKNIMRLALDGNYVPRSERESPTIASMLEATKATLNNVESAIFQENDTTATVAEIEEKVGNGNTYDAFESYASLVTKWPSAAADQRVTTALVSISDKEKSLVTKLNSDVVQFADVNFDPTKELVNRVSLPTLTGDTYPDLQGEVVPVLANGAAHGIDVATGKLIWRHFVGFETTIEPVWLDDPKRILLSDQNNNRLILVKPEDGEVVWAKEIGEPFLTPAISRSRIFLSTRSGKVARIDPESGDATAIVQLPQRLTVPATPNNSGNMLYQVGEHLNLYVLSVSLTDINCVQAYFVGHPDGAVSIPPMLLQNILIVPVNTGPQTSELRLLNNVDDSMELKTAGPSIEIKGVYRKPFSRYGNYLVTITTNGNLKVFEVAAEEDEFTLATVAGKSLNNPESQEIFMAAREGKIWIGTKGIVQFNVIRSKQELQDQNVADNADFFVGEMSPYEGLLVHVRKRAGSRMVSISGVNPEVLTEVWRLDIGGGLAGAPLVNNDQVVAVNSQGDFYEIDQAVISAGVKHQPKYRASKTQQDLVFTRRVQFADGSGYFIGPADRKDSISYVPSNNTLPVSLSELDILDLKVTADPVSFRDGVLIGLSNGEIRLVTPRSISGDAVFVPEAQVGVEFIWRRPCVLSTDTFAAANYDGRIFTVKYLPGDGTPYMAQIIESSSAQKIVGPLVKNGNLILSLAEGANGNEIIAFKQTDLKAQGTYALGGIATWGPESIGDTALATKEDGTLIGIRGDVENPAFEIKLPNGRGIGKPLSWKGKTILTLKDGQVAIVDLNAPGDGARIIDAGEPITGESAVAGDQLYVTTADGVLTVLDLSVAEDGRP